MGPDLLPGRFVEASRKASEDEVCRAQIAVGNPGQEDAILADGNHRPRRAIGDGEIGKAVGIRVNQRCCLGDVE